jgi:uncharacterized membrane protein YphA (DoxX/SURF4 family)
MPHSPTLSASDEQPLSRSRGAQEGSPHSGLFLLAGSAHRDPAATMFAWLGRLFIALSLIAFGVQHFRYSGFIPDLGLVPDWAPAHIVWAWLAGAALLLAGLSVLIGKYARLATFLLGFTFLLSAFLRFTPRFAGMVHNVSDRTVFFELLSCCGGSWMLSSLFTSADSPRIAPSLTQKLATLGRWFFAVSNIVFGIGHFQVAAYIAFLIPHWIPFRLFLAYFTGCAFIAAGVSIAARRFTRLSGALLGLMYFLWVVIVHAPRIAHALHNGDEWNSGYVCLAMAGCALIAAALTPHSDPEPI